MRDAELIKRAKSMRLEPTSMEHKLWLGLRAKRFNGAKFRQQAVIGPYIADFACRIPCMLVIEVDGDTHGDRVDYDARRTSFLEGRGYRVLRFSNIDVGENFEGVMMTIQSALPLSPALSPKWGEGGEPQ
ncbi:MAG TPA: DUF559 domain-containing protein [Sphingomicrobium sp.]|nr:DUF559 domain-containing protein [Sphingomicrobium sp.]